jgi:two pore calcium channel protein
MFNLVGIRCFGGKIRFDSPGIIRNSGIPDDYSLDNFNDFFSGFVTLFELMVVNNW